MNLRRWLPTLMAASLAGSLASAAPAYADRARARATPILSVGGEVTTPARYTLTQLAALPQTTATHRGRTEAGGRYVSGVVDIYVGTGPAS